ncbi:hypothetical protein EJ06DRAFT_152095 [Trichodelitschia bisporula]|uniref:Uncharacterized protein n=1 Tax=Trichodelitschia bisporula TaxID=703511 RepID=A0A6G1HNE0_9PEZI|nr:hypothetical protein EJ06DRAFT_152095 [Trichodelitschia bisporula]
MNITYFLSRTSPEIKIADIQPRIYLVRRVAHKREVGASDLNGMPVLESRRLVSAYPSGVRYPSAKDGANLRVPDGLEDIVAWHFSGVPSGIKNWVLGTVVPVRLKKMNGQQHSYPFRHTLDSPSLFGRELDNLDSIKSEVMDVACNEFGFGTVTSVLWCSVFLMCGT